MLVSNIYLGNKNIESAQLSLNKDQPGKAVQAAEQARNSFKAGQSSTKNIFLTIILPGLSNNLEQTKNYLFYGENISAATKFTALSLQIIIETEALEFSSEEIIKKLELVRLNLEQAENKLEIASAIEFEEDALLPPTKSLLESLKKDKADLLNLINTLQRALR